MSNYIYNYEEWLSGHANRKSMMEKLERSLIPYEIFEAINLNNDRLARSGEVTIGANTYSYSVTYEYKCIGNDVYHADLKVADLPDKWNNLLMGYNKFKVVMNHNNIKTIYSDHEDYFNQVIHMFETDDYAALYANRSSYINNLLARYILLRLLEVHRPELQLITTIDTKEDGRVNVLAANANRTEWIMYAFSKREAIEQAKRLDGCCKSLIIIYFFNQDFEKDGNMISYDTVGTHVISARSFIQSLDMETKEKRLVEKRMLMLLSMLYNEYLIWHQDSIERVVMNLPEFGKIKKKKDKKNRKKMEDLPIPWFNKIPRTLLEDALNVLNDDPKTHADIFHFLCASNLVNAYVNQCNRTFWNYSEKQVNRMYQAKQQIFNCIIRMARERNINVKISMDSMPAVLVNIKVEKMDFQFSFRGMSTTVYDLLISTGNCSTGNFSGHYLQPIAAALYKYSFLLRWKGICKYK